MNSENLEEFKERTQKEYGPVYFDRQGKGIDLMDWVRLFEDMNYKVIHQQVGNYFVSTIWGGLNMNFFRSHPRLIFETMIFLEDQKERDNDEFYGYQDRYSTEEEAILGHEKAVSLVKVKNKQAEKITIDKPNKEIN